MKDDMAVCSKKYEATDGKRAFSVAAPNLYGTQDSLQPPFLLSVLNSKLTPPSFYSLDLYRLFSFSLTGLIV